MGADGGGRMITGRTRYLDRAERLLRNHYLANQCSTGGFGHRYITSDVSGVTGIGKYSEEATWCCDFHGTQGFELLRPYVCNVKGKTAVLNFAMDFEVKGIIKSECDVLGYKDSVFVQRLSFKEGGDWSLKIRKPEWAGQVRVYVVGANGKEQLLRGVVRENYYLAVASLSGNSTVIAHYQAPVYRESRTGVAFKGDQSGREKHVVRHGPYVLMAEVDASGNVNPSLLQPRALRQDSLKTVMVF